MRKARMAECRRAAIALFLLSSAVGAQQPRPATAPARAPIAAPAAPLRLPAMGRQAEQAERPYAAVLDDSEEASHLLKRATEAVDRQDWKLAIDSLQRIVELPGDHVLRVEEGSYESARRHACRRIAALPQAGLDAYRLLYDGEAEARYARAVESHDEAAMREIVDRFLLTRHGERAALALAGWWLDEGRPAAAASLLQDLLEIYPDLSVARPVVEARLAMALALAGRPRAAETITRNWPTTLPAETTARLRSVREALAKIPSLAPTADPDAWPIFMGGPSRSGVMPLVEPSLAENSPWRLELSREMRSALAGVQEYQKRTQALPVMQPVTDGRVMVVPCEGRLVALDTETFEPLWQASPAARPVREAAQQRGAMAQRWGTTGGLNPAATYERNVRLLQALADSVGTSVTLAGGLAFTVARSPESLMMLSDLITRSTDPELVVFGERFSVSNQLIACDIETGKVRWRCGNPDESGETDAEPPATRPAGPRPPGLLRPAGDRLGAVEFLAPPLPVRDELLVPYRSTSDLYAAVLDRANGRLKRRIFLCGLGSGVVNSFEALHPCLADDVAYIPTGRGMFIALDTATWSIRWAVRYEGPPRPKPVRPERVAAEEMQRAGMTSNRWQNSPPIAAGGLVLLAPPDAGFLFAFDRSRGKILWRVERTDHVYLLGADSQHAWIVGPSVTCIRLETGEPAWKREVGPPTGRGAISGDRLYLPVSEQIAVLHAGTGRPMEKLDLPPGSGPCGNLLCWDGGMYVCGMREIRRFPDVQRSYAAAMKAHERDRTSPSAAIRLAWLEMMRDRPARALVALEKVPMDSNVGEAREVRLAEHVAHLRVEALLTLAAMPGTEAGKADELLRAARRAARSPADAVRAGMALADHLRRIGRPQEAYRQYAEIALATGSDELAEPMTPGDTFIEGSPGVQQPARLVIAARLGQIEKELTAESRAQLTAWLSGLLDAAVRRGGENDVRQVAHAADAGLLGDVGTRAALRLGIRAQRDERHEEAESRYQDVVRRGGPAELVAEALVRLAALHLAPDELHMPVLASGEIDRLENDFAATAVPASALALPQSGGDGRTQPQASDQGTITGKQAADRLRRRINPRVLAAHRRAMDDVRLGPPTVIAYCTQHVDTAPLTLRGPRPEPLADTLLLLAGWSEVRAHRASDGKLLWPATLRLLESPAAAAPSAAWPPVAIQESAGRVIPRPCGVYDGQVMVVNSNAGLHAIGLATGLRLWSRRFEVAPDAITASDAFLSADQGGLLSLDADGTLAMARTINGEDVRWRRDCAGNAPAGWAAVRVRGEFSVTIAAGLSQVSVYRTADGRHLGDTRFQQPDGKTRRLVSLAMFESVVCGPGGSSEVVARELAAPGVERWRLLCEDEGKPIAVTGLFKPQGDLLGVGCERGVVKLVNPTDGRVVLSARIGLPATSVFEGAVTDGVLCLYAATGDEKTPFKIVAVDARDGRLLWHRSPEPGEYWSQLQYMYPLDNALLRAAANAIPVARLIRPPSRTARPDVLNPADPQGETREPTKLRLAIVDKRTGRNIGEPKIVTTPEVEAMSAIGSVLAYPGCVVVSGDSTYVAFRVGAPPDGAAAQRNEAATSAPSKGGA